jgi:hypothetical protein
MHAHVAFASVQEVQQASDLQVMGAANFSKLWLCEGVDANAPFYMPESAEGAVTRIKVGTHG